MDDKKNIKIWEEIFKNHKWGQYPPVSLIKFIAKNFYKTVNRKDVKILEIGSGPGANLWFMAREGFTVYGIEGSDTACNNAIEKLQKEKLNANIGKIIAGDYHLKLNDFDDNYFDAIIDIESLYCNPIDKSKEIVNLAFNKLKKGGVMFSQTFADGTWGFDSKTNGYHGTYPTEGPLSDTGFARYVTKEDIDLLYKLENNEVTSIERQDLLLGNDKVIKEWLIELKKIS